MKTFSIVIIQGAVAENTDVPPVGGTFGFEPNLALLEIQKKI